MRTFLLLLLVLQMRSAFGADDVEMLIQHLGHPETRQRLNAQKELSELAEDQPREMLIRLAETYSETKDLETKARLEALLRSLAREWMFYHPPGFLGVNFRMVILPDDRKAIEILQVLQDGAAERAGIRANDLLLEFQGADIESMEDQSDFVERISSLYPGTMVGVVISRKGKEFQLTFPLGARPLDQMNVAVASRQEERKIKEWLIGLQKKSQESVDQPMGHFKTETP